MRNSERMLKLTTIVAVMAIAIATVPMAVDCGETDGEPIYGASDSFTYTIHYKDSTGKDATRSGSGTTDGSYWDITPQLPFGASMYGWDVPIKYLCVNENGEGDRYTNYATSSTPGRITDLWAIYDENASYIEVTDGATYTYQVGDTVALTMVGAGGMSGVSGHPSSLPKFAAGAVAAICGIIEETGTWTIKFATGGMGGPTTTKTVTLVVEERQTVDVSFSSNGSVIATQTLEPNGTATYVEPPAREGYTFAGWYSDEGYTSQYDFSSPVTSDITLYAKWIENPVTITFMVEGKVYSTLAVPKGSVGVVYTPVMVTGVFAGWYYDEGFTDKYDATRALDRDITLYAYGVPPLIFTSEPNASANIQQVSSYGMFFFDATDSSGRYQIEWDFGDGNTSTDAIAYNTYATPGVYTVTLKVTNIYGESSTTTYDVVYRDPAAEGGGRMTSVSSSSHSCASSEVVWSSEGSSELTQTAGGMS